MSGEGGFTLAEMQAEIRDRMPDLIGEASDAELVTYINRAHRFEIPSQVPGSTREGIWTFTTTAGVSEYAFRPHLVPAVGFVPEVETWVHSLDGVVFVGDYSIAIFRNPERFWWYYPPDSSTQQARPAAGLIHGDTLTLNPIPNAEYTVRAPGELYPAAISSSTSGNVIEYGPRAQAIVAKAAEMYARRYNHGDLARELEDEYAGYISVLRMQANAMPRSRKLRRSF